MALKGPWADQAGIQVCMSFALELVRAMGEGQSFGDGAKALLFSVWAVITVAMTPIWDLQCQAQLSPSLPLQLCVPAALSFSFLW